MFKNALLIQKNNNAPLVSISTNVIKHNVELCMVLINLKKGEVIRKHSLVMNDFTPLASQEHELNSICECNKSNL